MVPRPITISSACESVAVEPESRAVLLPVALVVLSKGSVVPVPLNSWAFIPVDMLELLCTVTTKLATEAML